MQPVYASLGRLGPGTATKFANSCLTCRWGCLRLHVPALCLAFGDTSPGCADSPLTIEAHICSYSLRWFSRAKSCDCGFVWGPLLGLEGDKHRSGSTLLHVLLAPANREVVAGQRTTRGQSRQHAQQCDKYTSLVRAIQSKKKIN